MPSLLCQQTDHRDDGLRAIGGRPTPVIYPAVGDTSGYTVTYSHDAVGNCVAVTWMIYGLISKSSLTHSSVALSSGSSSPGIVAQPWSST